MTQEETKTLKRPKTIKQVGKINNGLYFKRHQNFQRQPGWFKPTVASLSLTDYKGNWPKYKEQPFRILKSKQKQEDWEGRSEVKKGII